jgi:hypothetical protein
MFRFKVSIKWNSIYRPFPPGFKSESETGNKSLIGPKTQPRRWKDPWLFLNFLWMSRNFFYFLQNQKGCLACFFKTTTIEIQIKGLYKYCNLSFSLNLLIESQQTNWIVKFRTVLNKFLNAIFFRTIKHQTFVPKFTWIDFFKKAVFVPKLYLLPFP